MYPTIYQWARQLLGLDPTDTTTVPDSTFTLYGPSVVADLVDAYPCIAVAGVVTLAGNDLTSFEEGSGILVGIRYLLSPAGKQYAAKLTTSKVGPVEETYADTSVAELASRAENDARKALFRISCIRAAAWFTPLGTMTGARRVAESDALQTDQPFIIAPTVNPDIIV